MDLRKVLTPDCILLDLKGVRKDAIIAEMVDVLHAAGRIKDRAAVLKAVLEREHKMSTGMQHGVAIPHGKTDAVSELVAALAIKRDGVDFDALDGQPSKIFVMTISPPTRTGPHIQFLAQISQVLLDAHKRERILQAQNASDLIDALAS